MTIISDFIYYTVFYNLFHTLCFGLLPTSSFYRLPSYESEYSNPPGVSIQNTPLALGWVDLWSKDANKFFTRYDVGTKSQKVIKYQDWPVFEEGDVPEGLTYQVSAASLNVLSDPKGSTMGYTPRWTVSSIPEIAGMDENGVMPQSFAEFDLNPKSFYKPAIIGSWRQLKEQYFNSYTETVQSLAGTEHEHLVQIEQYARDKGLHILFADSNRNLIIDNIDNWSTQNDEDLKYLRYIGSEYYYCDNYGKCDSRVWCGDWWSNLHSDPDHPAKLRDLLFIKDFWTRKLTSKYRAIAKYLNTRKEVVEKYKLEGKKTALDTELDDIKAMLDIEFKDIAQLISNCTSTKCRNILSSDRITFDDIQELKKIYPAFAAQVAGSNSLHPKPKHGMNPENPTVEDRYKYRRQYAPNIHYIRGLEGTKEARLYSNKYFEQKPMNRKGVPEKLQDPKALQRERFWRAQRSRYHDTQKGLTGTRYSWNNFRGPDLCKDIYATRGYRNKGYIFGNRKLNYPTRTAFVGRV